MTVPAEDLSTLHSRVMIGLGSNMSEPIRQIRTALREIDELAGCSLMRVSSLYESAPIGGVAQPPFVNAVAEIETTLSPQVLMARLLDIERLHDRVRTVKNGPRTLDLDILVFNDWCLDEVEVTTPHPRAHERAFVLLPLLELAPELYIPGKGLARDFLPQVSGQSVRKMIETEGRPKP